MISLDLKCPESYLILCPWCGDCWARVSGEDQTFWSHRYVPCINHPQASFAYARVAGSLVDAEPILLDYLPSDLIAQEFHIFCSKET
jgi:hypothetical protein